LEGSACAVTDIRRISSEWRGKNHEETESVQSMCPLRSVPMWQKESISARICGTPCSSECADVTCTAGHSGMSCEGHNSKNETSNRFYGVVNMALGGTYEEAMLPTEPSTVRAHTGHARSATGHGPLCTVPLPPVTVHVRTHPQCNTLHAGRAASQQGLLVAPVMYAPCSFTSTPPYVFMAQRLHGRVRLWVRTAELSLNIVRAFNRENYITRSFVICTLRQV
jgi:hypothetical protein